MDACPGSSGKENSFQQAELLWPLLSLPMSHLALRAWPGTAPHHLPNPDTIQHHAAIHFVIQGFKVQLPRGRLRPHYISLDPFLP